MPVTRRKDKCCVFFFVGESVYRQTYHETFQLFRDISCYKAALLIMFAQGMFKDVMLKAYSMSFYGKGELFLLDAEGECPRKRHVIFSLFT